jgi:hypothetical protein
MFTNDYVAQQAQHFGARQRVVDEQSLGTSQNHHSNLFSNFPYTNAGRDYAIREHPAAKRQRIISIDYKSA